MSSTWSMRARIRHARAGIEYGYPICCVLRFSLSRTWGQAETRGIRYTRSGLGRYVPCLIVHPPHRTWAQDSAKPLERMRLAAILIKQRRDEAAEGSLAA